MSYNSDGSANITPTAEVTGIDEVDDWIEGSYRPVCNVRPKIQFTGDAHWVARSAYALGQAVDYARTGQAVYIPADSSTITLQYAVEVDVLCSGAPSPSYYLYPGVASLNSWAEIDPSFWYLEGFEPAQTGPPYWSQYCPAGSACSVVYGVASIRNFVDFADFFEDTTMAFRGIPYRDVYSQATYCQPPAAGWDRKVFGQVFNQLVVAFTTDDIPMTETVSLGGRNDLGLSNPQIGTTTTSYDPYAQPPRHGAYDDRFFFCSVHCPGSGETDAIQTLTWGGQKVLHSNLLAYKCGGITVDGH